MSVVAVKGVYENVYCIGIKDYYYNLISRGADEDTKMKLLNLKNIADADPDNKNNADVFERAIKEHVTENKDMFDVADKNAINVIKGILESLGCTPVLVSVDMYWFKQPDVSVGGKYDIGVVTTCINDLLGDMQLVVEPFAYFTKLAVLGKVTIGIYADREGDPLQAYASGVEGIDSETVFKLLA